jgi:K+-transporting ATPase A subunit
MTAQMWLQIGLVLLIVFLLGIPVGRYLAAIVMDRKTWFDPVFDRIDNAIYLLISRKATRQPMNWKSYTFHMLATNSFMGVLIYLILVFQDHLPLNPLEFPGMEPMLALNTAISFVTNTDWQSYGGETTLSNFSQMAAITFPMFTSATTGFVVAMAFIHDLARRASNPPCQYGSAPDPGRRADHRAGSGRIVGDDQASGYQWRRLFQCQCGTSLRKSDAPDQLAVDDLDGASP